MKLMGDFAKILFWIGALALLRFFIEHWIITQSYSLYSTLTGLGFFILIAYISYRGLKS